MFFKLYYQAGLNKMSKVIPLSHPLEKNLLPARENEEERKMDWAIIHMNGRAEKVQAPMGEEKVGPN